MENAQRTATVFEIVESGWRQLLRYVCLIAASVILMSIAYAFASSALTHAPVPDMSGGLTAAVVALIPLAIEQFNRSRESNSAARPRLTWPRITPAPAEPLPPHPDGAPRPQSFAAGFDASPGRKSKLTWLFIAIAIFIGTIVLVRWGEDFASLFGHRTAGQVEAEWRSENAGVNEDVARFERDGAAHAVKQVERTMETRERTAEVLRQSQREIAHVVEVLPPEIGPEVFADLNARYHAASERLWHDYGAVGPGGDDPAARRPRDVLPA